MTGKWVWLWQMPLGTDCIMLDSTGTDSATRLIGLSCKTSIFSCLPALQEKFAQNCQKYPTPQFLPIDLVTVRKSSGRNTYPHLFLPADFMTVSISSSRFGETGSGNLLAEFPPFLLADLLTVSKSASRFSDHQ